MLRIALVENLECAKQANCWSLIEHLSVVLTEPKLLTRWLPAYDIFVLRFRPKKQQFSVALPTP